MIVERIQTAEGFAGLRKEWNSLLALSTSSCVFLTHEWLFTWWEHLSSGRTLSILTARSEGRLVGILPVALRQRQYSRMMPRSLEFIGSGMIGSDYLDAIVMPGFEQEVICRFAEYLDRMGVVVHFSAVRRESSIVAELATQLRKQGWNVADAEINVCPFVDFRGQTWETYLSSLGSSQRYNFNRRLKQLYKNFNFNLQIVDSPEAAQSALEDVINLHRKRWTSREPSEAFQDNPTVAFHREFVKLAATRGWLRILVGRIDGAPVAALYGLRYGKTFYFYQSGFDPAWGRQSVGLVMMGLAIQSAINEGAMEYDLLHGQEEYKFHWTRQTRGLGRIELYPHHSKGRLSRRAVDFNRAVRKMAKRMLGRAA
jgi:CelD/BcsL family acetyltransferase involved in cellulose biosynthesis